uniref:Uncharacterized protein n=1 Tax=Oryza punctata TaxID=4537 RepID=A0A0E0JI59_ORYPU
MAHRRRFSPTHPTPLPVAVECARPPLAPIPRSTVVGAWRRRRRAGFERTESRARHERGTGQQRLASTPSVQPLPGGSQRPAPTPSALPLPGTLLPLRSPNLVAARSTTKPLVDKINCEDKHYYYMRAWTRQPLYCILLEN